MAEREPITVEQATHEKGLVLTPVGEISYHEAPAFRNAIQQALERRPPTLVIDLSKVSYMGTPGLATLVEALQTTRKTNRNLVLVALTERVRAVFEIARLHSVFRIVNTVDEAMAAH